ncbi:MAG: aldo/keto reductase [Clostridiales bacterium]|nr:aldo/keto reductase [Clostridiales bacterium]
MQKRKGISILGYGCMRFVTKNGRIDFDKAEKEFMRAYELGVNYFDTAYIYPGNEEIVGRIIEKNNLRDKINLATKLPQYLVKSRASLDKYFDEELKRLRTDYIDYYLMHHMTDHTQWEKLEALGIIEWLAEKKAEGKIRHVGFSFHGTTEEFLKILNSYDWEMCLVQYNYVDEHTQAGKKGVHAAAEKGIPVMIMEPLRGGKLVDLLPEKAKKTIAADHHGWSPAEWAFRWLWNQEDVTCVLSGMNSIEMIEENCRIASEAQAGSFTDEELQFLAGIKQIIIDTTKVNCSGCRYCMPCPKGVNIPGIFSCYNHMYSESKSSGRLEYFQTIALRSEPCEANLCVKCGKCEQHCPQNIPIREKLVEADKALNPPFIKLYNKAAKRVMVGKKKKNKG